MQTLTYQCSNCILKTRPGQTVFDVGGLGRKLYSYSTIFQTPWVFLMFKQSTKLKKEDFCEAVTLASRLMTFAARNKI